MINIKGLDKARILAALHRRARVQGRGFVSYGMKPEPLTVEEARRLLEKQTYFDYLYGRVLKVDLSRDHLDPRLYDRDMGTGAAEYAILDEFTNPTN